MNNYFEKNGKLKIWKDGTSRYILNGKTPLDRETEYFLFQQLEGLKRKLSINKTKIIKLKNIILEANMRLIAFISSKYNGKGVEVSDLIQDASIEVLRRIDKFDYLLGNRLNTYITPAIRNSIQKSIRRGCESKKTWHIYFIDKKINNFRDEHFTKNGIFPNDELILDSVDISEQQLINTKKRTKNIMYDIDDLDSKINYNVDHHVLDMPEPKDVIFSKNIKKALDILTNDQRLILKYRYGLADGNCYTFRKISEMFDVTFQRICQIEKIALKRLRKYFGIE